MITATRLGILEGAVSIAVNTLLFLLKFSVGRRIGSIAMIADAWHTLADMLTSVVVILGFWVASTRADKRHPFGHGRAELIASVVIATLLGVVGFNFFSESAMRLASRRSAEFSIMAVLIFGASAIIKEALARFSFWAGRRSNAQSLAADGWHHRSDAAASLIIVAGAIFGLRWWWMDSVLGMGVSLLILYAALDILRSSASPLLGEAPDPDLENRLNTIVRKHVSPDSSVHHIHVHRYGNHSEVSFHVRMPPDMHLSESHDRITAVEKDVNSSLSMQATIHTEPLQQP